MAKRRVIRGKKLLIVSASIAGASFLGCGGDREPGPVANLVVPPMDSGTRDAMPDAPVANLVAPPDSSFEMDAAAQDGSVDDGSVDDGSVDDGSIDDGGADDGGAPDSGDAA